MDEHNASGDRYFAQHVIRKEHISYDDGVVYSFASNAPVFPGHTLITPVRVAAYLRDLTVDELAHMVKFQCAVLPTLSRIYKNAAFELGIQNGADAGMSVRHCHQHIIPIPGCVLRPGDGAAGEALVSPDDGRHVMSSEEQSEYARRVSASLASVPEDVSVREWIRPLEDTRGGPAGCISLGGLRCDVLLSTSHFDVCLYSRRICPRKTDNLHVVIAPKERYRDTECVPYGIFLSLYILAKVVCSVLQETKDSVNVIPTTKSVGMKENHWALHVVQRSKNDFEHIDLFYPAIRGTAPFTSEGYGDYDIPEETKAALKNKILKELMELLPSVF